ncbi:sugar phosphate isomerase/epimerase [Halobacteria archaeon AArc-m2/3/4]|uniref:Sugar phosphate isomerase/epimerase n=1 Tax=Natronoglomus mannanivorans TaxID=2979990 RepID=A0ABT2QAR3_9EURY|nr:sugar phosphate isomerase/epimerase [Halobacteria archaeon AArc-m2/3/4]
MRLGGPVDTDESDPNAWIAELEKRGYRAAAAPVGPDASDETVQAYREAARAADVEIAEVGAWGANPISDDPEIRAAGIDQCQRALRLADELGARCAVDVAGSRGESWDGPHPENFSDETFYRIVDAVQEIVDGVEPENAVYTLEPMPWVYPHDVESYRRLVDAIDREAFGVHFDPVNMITSPQRYARDADFVREFVAEFGDDIEVVHLKDVTLADELTVHIDEVRPGAGELDYHVLLSVLDELDDDLPVLLEHLDSEQAYERARAYVREVADEVGVTV